MKFQKLFFLLSILWANNIYNKPQFNDILLLINYNYPHYQTIDFIKELYSAYFPHIVFYGPHPHPQIELCIQEKGYYSYKAIAQAMQKFPNFKGYLFVHDDCIINPWNLTRFDPKKIWTPNCCLTVRKIESTWNIASLDGITQEWYWWQKPNGAVALKKAYAKLPEKNRSILIKNCGTNAGMWGYSDIIYIPNIYKKDVIYLINIFAQEHVFLELALPTLCAAIQDKESWEYMNGIAIWDHSDAKNLYTQNIDYLHPLKLSDINNQNFIKSQFKNFLTM
jgi:hypothetical protein